MFPFDSLDAAKALKCLIVTVNYALRFIKCGDPSHKLIYKLHSQYSCKSDSPKPELEVMRTPTDGIDQPGASGSAGMEILQGGCPP